MEISNLLMKATLATIECETAGTFNDPGWED